AVWRGRRDRTAAGLCTRPARGDPAASRVWGRHGRGPPAPGQHVSTPPVCRRRQALQRGKKPPAPSAGAGGS
ncbi:MAG TPA: hypothetical protein VIH59_12390, partial [Candidatus Tectomicrobia bacterium]